MCSIIGMIAYDLEGDDRIQINDDLNYIFAVSEARGRDGWGYQINAGPHTCGHRSTKKRGGWFESDRWRFIGSRCQSATLIGNMRAEPTTEYVNEKSVDDQQPYTLGPWSIVHNGTVANDKALRTNEIYTKIDSAAIVEHLNGMGVCGGIEEAIAHFKRAVNGIVGSYAILATHQMFPGVIFAACNYRPIWYARRRKATYFASRRDAFPDGLAPQMMKPYTMRVFEKGSDYTIQSVRVRNEKALVICSGGLDSTVAAAVMKCRGYEVELLHFQYGSRAEGPEDRAVRAIAERLEVPLRIFPLPIYNPKDSPLLQADSTIAGGEEGAEFAHEWVPARNLVMLSVATAIAEANGFETIVLGNNLEEAGAYPDNEPEFIDRFNDLLPFAVGDKKIVRVVMPVGNLMKHEIVAKGLEVNAPLDLTWSCYRAGEQHCGTCGPCYMRRKAFEINGAPEVIKYLNEEN